MLSSFLIVNFLLPVLLPGAKLPERSGQVAIIAVCSLGVYDEVAFIINNVLGVVSHFYNSFGNKDATAIGIRGADLFIICVV